MSQINTILIKRRLGSSPLNTLPVLSGGELAFSEKNNTLYYGGEFGTLAIAGSGAFVSLNGDQTISDNKTFLGTTTLSSITVSPDSLIDFGNNVLTNVAYPSAADHAATKQYVDDNYIPVTITGDFVNRTDAQDISGVKTFFNTANFLETVSVTKFVNASAYKVNGTEVITNDLDASFRNINASGNLTVQGDFTVLGNSTVLETTITAASAFSITNTGSGPALMVTQTGAADIAAFYDGDGLDTALIIKDGGNVGINTATPNERLTVNGNISASGTIYAGGNFEVSGGGVNTTLYVEDGLVGINTETPNEALTVVGSISATQDIYARNGTFTGYLSSVGALTVDGTATLNSDLTVIDLATVKTSDYVAYTAGKAVIADATNGKLTVENGSNSWLVDYTSDGIDSQVNPNGFTITTFADAGAGIKFTPAVGSNTNVTIGDLLGNGTNYLGDFIIDGGSF